MQIDYRREQHDPPARVRITPRADTLQIPSPDNAPRTIHLTWYHALDSDGYLCRCPACDCRELFSRKDFPQQLGLIIVILAASTALVLFALNLVFPAFAVLISLAIIDAIVYLLVPRCLVCYRCRSEFRETPIRPGHPGWNLATGEKYRPDTQHDDKPSESKT
jgi:hypothetical protein